jgi:hypothetical protein
MMRVKVLRKMSYSDTWIYVMHFGHIFQYLFSWHSEIYQQHIFVKPAWYRRLGYALRLCNLYTIDQVESSEGIVLSGAMKSIDKLNKLGYKKVKEQRRKQEQKANSCLWQVRVGDDNKTQVYYCLKHHQIQPIIEGEPPRPCRTGRNTNAQRESSIQKT